MIDSIRLRADDFSVSSGCGLRLRPSSYVISEGPPSVDHPLWETEDGEVVEGEKAYLNVEDRFGLTVSPRGCYLQFSIPKICSGSPNNLETVAPADMADSFRVVEQELRDQGVRMNLHRAKIIRIDTCRTPRVDEPVSSYGPVLSAVNGKRVSRREYGGGAWLFHNTQQQISVYDKGLELVGRGVPAAELPAGNLMRFEHRLLNARKVKAVYGFNRVRDLVGNFDVLPSAYERAMEDQLFSMEMDNRMIHSVGRVKAAFDFKLREGKRNWASEALVLCCIDGVLPSGDVLAAAMSDAGVDDRQQRRLQRRLAQWRLQRVALDHEFVVPGKTVADLYCELKSKVLERAA